MTTSAPEMQKRAEEARSLLANHVQKPAFFAKLAYYGIVPQTAAQERTMVGIGNMLLEAHAKASKAQQRSVESGLEQARVKLAQTLYENGLLEELPEEAVQQKTVLLGKYAAEAAADPEIAEACEAWKSHYSSTHRT